MELQLFLQSQSTNANALKNTLCYINNEKNCLYLHNFLFLFYMASNIVQYTDTCVLPL